MRRPEKPKILIWGTSNMVSVILDASTASAASWTNH